VVKSHVPHHEDIYMWKWKCSSMCSKPQC